MFHNAYTNIMDMHLILIIKLILHNLIIYPLDQVENISKPSTTKVYMCVSVCVCVTRSVVSNSLGPHGLQPPGSLAHGIFQARILEWVLFPTPQDLSDLESETASLMSPAVAGGFFISSATWEAHHEDNPSY